MNFASRSFFIFLPVVLVGYHALRSRRHKYLFLLAASWFFYMSWNPWFIGVIVFTSVVDYAAGLLIEGATDGSGRRAWLAVSVATNLGFLAIFKYTNFFLANSLALARMAGWNVSPLAMHIVLPLGISFHTFQGISYTYDVYQRKIPAVRSFIDFALFVAFFPQLVAGPIVRAVEFLPQMLTPPGVRPDQVTAGLHWFVVGLFKKVFLADRLAQFVDPVFGHPALYDASTLRWAVLAYAAQIYCDFSGYSDIAIGCAKWFGFELPRNFRFPYLAASLTEFWRRWHISLSMWMRDYLYVPLGGSRGGGMRTHVNLLLTMTLCGFWHGASWNYVLWGFYNGVLLCLHRLYSRFLDGRPAGNRLRSAIAYRALAIFATFMLVAAGLIMVRSESWAGCRLVEWAWFGGGLAPAAHLVPAWMTLLVAMVAAGHASSLLGNAEGGFRVLPPVARSAAYVSAIVLIVAFSPESTKPFIYFQF